MKDEEKSKAQLLSELAELRQRVAELEAMEAEREQAEAAGKSRSRALHEMLEESEEIFRLFMEYSPIYVFFKDENTRPIRLSKNYEKMLGRPIEELLGKTMDELFPSELAKSMTEDDLRILREGKPFEVVEELNGRIYTTTKFPIIKQGRPSLLAGFTIDITERVSAEQAGKRAEEALRRQNEYLTALQETTLDLISRLDLDSLLENIVRRAGQLVGTTAGFLDLVEPGVDRLQPRVGMGALTESLKFPVVRGEGLAGLVWQTGKPLVIDDYDVWPDRIGNFSRDMICSIVGVPLLSGSQVLGVLGLAYEAATKRTFGPEAVDLLTQFARLAAIAIENARLFSAVQRELAERKRAEAAEEQHREALRNSQNQLELIANEIPALLAFIDSEQRYLYVNRRYAEWYGHPKEAFIGKHIWEILNEKAYQKSVPYYTAVLQGQQVSFENTVRDKSGQERTVWVTLVPHFDSQGSVQAFFGLIQDVTERRQAEDALRQSNLELQARNDELDAFAHTVAHDLKTPLGLVIGYAELLAQYYDTLSDAQRKSSAQVLAKSGRKMCNIIEELLLLSAVRKSEVETSPLDMASVVNETRQRLSDMLADSKAQLVAPDKWPVAMGYGPWVEEVWVNYMSNALKYGGRPPHVELGAAALPDGAVCFWVRDNGDGILPADQAKLFTPYTRLEQARAKGHGLGLSIVKRIVEKLGGQVGVKSDGVPGKGSVFFFTLPGVIGEEK